MGPKGSNQNNNYVQASITLVRQRWRRKRVKTMKDQAEGFNIFGPHIINFLQQCRWCLCHEIFHQVWLVSLNWLILIHGCNIISYIMKGYYQIIICLISFTFVANLNGRYILIVLSMYKWLMNFDIVLRKSIVQVIFRHASFAEKQGGTCWHRTLAWWKT